MRERLEAELELVGSDDEQFVERLYRLVLRRPVEEPARSETLARLETGLVSRATLLQEVVGSEEFERVKALDDAVACAVWARTRAERPRALVAPPAVDERPVEIAWTLARVRAGARVLDVGTANAEPAYLAALRGLGAAELSGVDLAPGEIPGLRLVQGDVRALPFRRRAFDYAICISTLEHVGRDNSVYGVEASGEGGADEALRELRRVLKRDGSLLLTVPTGEPDDQGWFRQRPPDEWLDLATRAGFRVREHELYRHGSDGWRAVVELEPGVRYGEPGPGAGAILCAELVPDDRLGRLIRKRRWQAERRRVERGGRASGA
ncbi:MAG: class I SAM-dependent methyltransferase [Gaiellaceae bacterium]